MKTSQLFAMGMAALLSPAILPAQAPKAAGDADIRFALDSAASDLGWLAQVESAPLSAEDTVYVVRDTSGVLAITHYGSSEGAEKAFRSSSSGEKRRFHQFDALAGAGQSSLTWMADKLVFSAGSGSGDAEKLAEFLFQAATKSGLIAQPAMPETPSVDAGKTSTEMEKAPAGNSGMTSAGEEKISNGIGSAMAGPGPASEAGPGALNKLRAEYGRPLPDGAVNEAAEMARQIYGVDFRKTVVKAADGDRGELANLFVMSLDGAAAEIHAEVLYLLREGLGPKVFDEALSRQAGISQDRVKGLITQHRENLGLDVAPPPADMPPPSSPAVVAAPPAMAPVPEPEPEPEPGSFLAGGTFEGTALPGTGEGKIVRDPADPGNQVLAITAEDYLARPLAVPADVNDVKVALRVLAPPSIQLETLEPGRVAPGVKIRVRHRNAQGDSGIGEWIVKPMDGWQQLTMTLKDIGDFRKELSLEASWFAGAIFLDDLTVTSAFPVFLADEMYEHFQTPAQVVYFYVLDPLFSSGRVSNVGSPEITGERVSIDFVLEGEKKTLWFVERSRDGDGAEVVVGPPNAGGDLFRLRRIDGKWAIAGIEEADGI